LALAHDFHENHQNGVHQPQAPAIYDQKQVDIGIGPAVFESQGAGNGHAAHEGEAL